MNEEAPGRAPVTPPSPDDPGVDLPTALLRGSLRVAQQRVIGILVALVGLATGFLILTLGSVAAAWNTPYRWLVLLGVAALYLILGSVGVWLLLRPIDDPDLQASREKLAELQLRVQQFTSRLGGDGEDASGPGGFHPRSRTLQWVASLGALPIPWARLVQYVMMWRSIRRRRR